MNSTKLIIVKTPDHQLVEQPQLVQLLVPHERTFFKNSKIASSVKIGHDSELANFSSLFLWHFHEEWVKSEVTRNYQKFPMEVYFPNTVNTL